MNHYYIYCLHNENLPEYYVGHTKDLYQRWHCHKTDGNGRSSNRKVYQYINNNGRINNFKMEVLDEIYCDLQEAIQLERYYTELLGATLNSDVPGRTHKEYSALHDPIYYKNNKEQILEKKKVYYINNKETIREKQDQKFTCICNSEIRKNEKQRHFKSQKHINFIRENIGY